ncbi:hypothetical protein GGX14DRAFT_656275 [Mycena pura]|uniref:Uncharacterized protein n=1 Tax=Mycena pura TaxID=153505 RepID=A0AAD6Y4Q7_9AGAR|nr:hypothetical protein GGX14DRAFT_656275 [Mycena pura]
MARVDCHLISGCELSLDTDNTLLKENGESVLAVLITETGQMPVRIRRHFLALSRLRYIAALDPSRVVHSAFLDCVVPMPIEMLKVEAIEAVAEKIIKMLTCNTTSTAS